MGELIWVLKQVFGVKVWWISSINNEIEMETFRIMSQTGSILLTTFVLENGFVKAAYGIESVND